MNLHKPYWLTIVDKNDNRVRIVLKEYELFHLNLSELMLTKGHKSVTIEEVPDYCLYLYDGFYCEYDGQRYVAHDLRVNESMNFVADSPQKLWLMIEDCLHSVALEEDKSRTQAALRKVK